MQRVATRGVSAIATALFIILIALLLSGLAFSRA
jgi:hypothetical protein